MRIVDADTHISSDLHGNRISAEDHIEQMDKNEICCSLIWLHPNQQENEYCDFEAQNRYIYESSKKYSGRFLPVGWINPKVYGMNQIKEQILRQTLEYGFCGIKMNGAQNFYDLLDPQISLPAIEEIAKHNVFLAFHSGNDTYTHPDKVAYIAGLYPEIPILLVHVGQTACSAAIEAAKQCSNIFLVGSGMPDISPVLTAYETIGAERICFGSDTPFFDIRKTIDTYNSLFENNISEDDLNSIMGANILHLFNRD